MAEEMEAIQPQETDKPTQSYISRVRLKGYKSIIDTEVTFKPGLNIIIGANGSGKTNFVEFLEKILKLKIDKISDRYNIEVEFFYKAKKNNYSMSYDVKMIENFNILTSNIEEKFISNSSDGFDHKDEPQPRVGNKIEWASIYPSNVSYGIPNNFNNINNLINFEILPASAIFMDSPEPNRIISYKADPPVTDGLNNLLKSFFQNLITKDNRNNEFFKYFKSYLKKFTPIKDIKASDNFSHIIDKKGKLSVEYIRLEFQIENNWLTWNQLSDGTKRMFYIITEITFANNVVLLEEPELGIHPHQLIRLMDFIKEQSETKQIIMTTHSPEVLNTLKMDELDRIIVARYDKEKGTQMSHLSEDDIAHARSYMKDELFLSDYWVMSGFETEEEAV